MLLSAGGLLSSEINRLCWAKGIDLHTCVQMWLITLYVWESVVSFSGEKKTFGRWEARVPLLCHWGRCEGHCRGAGQLPQVTRHHLNQKWPGAVRFPVALFLGWCNKRWYMPCPISDIISARYIHMCRKQKHRSAKMYHGFTVFMSKWRCIFLK